MKRRISVLAAAAALAAVGSTTGQFTPPFELDDASVIVEHNVTNGDSALILEADSHDPLRSVELRNPQGAPMLRLQARTGQLLGVGGLRIETSDGDWNGLLATCPEGLYPFLGRTVAGRLAFGEAWLSHSMPAAPTITAPLPGATLDADAVRIEWAADPSAVEHRIGLEQGDTDTMVARVASGRSSFETPAGVLRPGELTKVEVIAVGANGNRTAVEVEFWTR